MAKLKNIKADYFVNFATLYNNTHSHDQIPGFINSNILFPTIIYDLMSGNTKKMINFGSMMQHLKDEKLTSQNLYTATKNAFEMIGNYYSNINNGILLNIRVNNQHSVVSVNTHRTSCAKRVSVSVASGICEVGGG